MSLSPLFEAAFKRAKLEEDLFFVILDDIEWSFKADPDGCGERHPAFEADIRIWESPSLTGWPKISILFEVDHEAGRFILRDIRNMRGSDHD